MMRLHAQRRLFRIYTKTGDKGTSMLFNGTRRRKDDAVFAALGDSDELNAAIGVARAQMNQQSTNAEYARLGLQLSIVQARVLDVGSAIATPLGQSSEKRQARAAFNEDEASTTAQLEQWIDEMDEQLPPLREFIIPGDCVISSSLHVARAICRRTERSVTPLVLAGECDPDTSIYLNRLSDYLFTAARLVAPHDTKRHEAPSHAKLVNAKK